MLNKIEPSLRSHAMAVICGHTVSEASWHGDVNKPRTERKTSCGFCHRRSVPDFEHVMWQCDVFHNRPVKPSSVVQSTLGWHDCATETDYGEAVLRHMASVRAALVRLRKSI